MNKIKVGRKLRKPTFTFIAGSLDDAYHKGYFCGSITRNELMERIMKYNDELRWYANKTHRGLFDSFRGKFICGITHNMTIPKYSISQLNKRYERELPTLQHDGSVKTQYIQTDPDEGKIIARGWYPTLQMVEAKGYKVDWEDLK